MTLIKTSYYAMWFISKAMYAPLLHILLKLLIYDKKIKFCYFAGESSSFLTFVFHLEWNLLQIDGCRKYQVSIIWRNLDYQMSKLTINQSNRRYSVLIINSIWTRFSVCLFSHIYCILSLIIDSYKLLHVTNILTK